MGVIWIEGGVLKIKKQIGQKASWTTSLIQHSFELLFGPGYEIPTPSMSQEPRLKLSHFISSITELTHSTNVISKQGRQDTHLL